MMITKEKDKDTIINTDSWHYWNILPLKAHREAEGMPEVGFIMADNKTRVYIGNIFQIDRAKPIDQQGFKYIDYPSIDNLLITWQVD